MNRSIKEIVSIYGINPEKCHPDVDYWEMFEHKRYKGEKTLAISISKTDLYDDSTDGLMSCPNYLHRNISNDCYCDQTYYYKPLKD